MSQEISGRRSAVYTDELIVALEHLRLVEEVLAGEDVATGPVEESADLGLALVPLLDVTRAAAQLAPARPATEAQGGTPMDVVLAALRTRFDSRYVGWVPTMGKNRLVGDVFGGGGKISHGGDTAPTPVETFLERRSAGPGQGVRVGVLDTGVSAHPWLAGGWTAAAADVLPSSAPVDAVAGHATFITGLVLQHAPSCTVEVRRVLRDNGEATSWDAAKAIAAFGRSPLDVLNLSFLCHTEDGRAPLVLTAAIESLDRDVVVVAAAGNHGNPEHAQEPGDERRPAWPAALDNVVAVGAADGGSRAASFTPRDVPWIDVLAPGEEVVSVFPPSGYASWSGSSFAAARVTGRIAAATVPGRLPARAAWEALRGQAQGTPPCLT